MRRTRMGVALGLALAAIGSAAHAQKPWPGTIGTGPNGTGFSLFHDDGKGNNNPAFFALCSPKDGKVTVHVPVPGASDPIRNSGTIGRRTEVRFVVGRDEFRFSGPIDDNGAIGWLEMTFSVVVGHNLFKAMRTASSMRMSGPAGSLVLGFPPAASAVDSWNTSCGYKPPPPSPLEKTGKVGDVHPADPAGGPPPILAARRDAYAAECRTAGGQPSFTNGFVRPGDFNGDGRPDYLLDLGSLDCPNGRLHCGAAGCSVDVFMSEKDGRYREAEGWIGIASVDVQRAGDRDLVVLGGRGGLTRHRWTGSRFERVR